jgi:signal transduction histidine kinase
MLYLKIKKLNKNGGSMKSRKNLSTKKSRLLRQSSEDIKLELRNNKLIKQIDELKKKNDRLQLLSKILRHDLNNDFAVIKSAINIFNHTKNGDMLTEAQKRVNFSVGFIEKIKNLEAGISEKKLELRNIRTVIENIKDKHLIEINITGDGKAFINDMGESVFNNIISNAIKHGGATIIDILIQIDPKTRITIVKIKNNGDGIDEKILKYVFMEGVKSNKTGNTGIGLHIVKETMQEYSGTCSIITNEPKNVCFQLEFPRV